MSKYRVISGLYFLVFSPTAGKYETEITPYLDTFHAVTVFKDVLQNNLQLYWKKLQQKLFPVNFKEFLRTVFSNNTSGLVL